MKEYLSQNNHHQYISEFRFTTSDFSALPKEGNHEISVGGEWYDVLQIKKQDDKVIVRCLADKKESVLLETYQKQIEKNSTGKSDASLLLKLLSTPFSPVIPFSLAPLQNAYLNHTASCNENILSCLKEILTPPPRAC